MLKYKKEVQFMEISSKTKLNQDQRFLKIIGLGLLTSLIVGFVVGYLRTLINFDFFLIINGLAIAYVIREFGRGVKLRFSIMSVIFVLISIFISDMIFNYGVVGFFDIENYVLLFRFAFIYELGKPAWFISRMISIFLAFNYARIA